MTDDVPRRRRRWVGWVVGAAILAVVLAGGWLGVRGIGAGLALSSAADAAAEARTRIAGGDTENLALVLSRGSAHAANARTLTSDPVWRAAEYVPLLGPGLRDMRISAEAADELAAAIPPLQEALMRARLGSFELAGGRMNLTRIQAAAPHLADAARIAHRVDSTLAQVGGGAEDTGAAGELRSVVRSIQIASGAADLLPIMLGATEQRTLLVFVQDEPLGAPVDGEATAPVSAAVVRADAGTISIRAGRALRAPVEGDTFPLAAESGAAAAKAHTVIVTDTALMTALVDLTGPLTIDEAEYGEADVAAALAEGGPAFAGKIITAVNARVADGSVAAASLFSVLVDAGERGQIRIWSADEAVQRRLQQTPLAGTG